MLDLDAIERESAADLAAAEGATPGELAVFTRSDGDRSIRVVPGGSWVAYVREQDAAHFARQSPARTAARHAETMAMVQRIRELEAERDWLRMLVREAYREGFGDGEGHGNLEWKYPPEKDAWLESETCAALQRGGGEG